MYFNDVYDYLKKKREKCRASVESAVSKFAGKLDGITRKRGNKQFTQYNDTILNTKNQSFCSYCDLFLFINYLTYSLTFK